MRCPPIPLISCALVGLGSSPLESSEPEEEVEDSDERPGRMKLEPGWASRLESISFVWAMGSERLGEEEEGEVGSVDCEGGRVGKSYQLLFDKVVYCEELETVEGFRLEFRTVRVSAMASCQSFCMGAGCLRGLAVGSGSIFNL